MELKPVLSLLERDQAAVLLGDLIAELGVDSPEAIAQAHLIARFEDAQRRRLPRSERYFLGSGRSARRNPDLSL